MSGRADLHIHSTASDGAMTPTEVVREAARVGLGAISIVDHDTVHGLDEAEQAAREEGLESVPGVEINTDYGNTEIHIIGYFIDPDNATLRDGLRTLRQARLDRGAKIVGKLRDLGVPVTMERVLEISGRGSVGRPHIAQAICETGMVNSMNCAFGRYLVRGAPAFVPRARMCPKEAVGLVLASGGVPCLAHPGKIGTDVVIGELVDAGLQALEVYHSDQSRDVSEHYRKVAGKFGLIMTGGSDSHGMLTGKPIPIGNATVDLEVVEQLRKASKNGQVQ